MGVNDSGHESEPNGELAYIKYSAKEILFHLTTKVEILQNDVNEIKRNMVSRDELTGARRWAVGAVFAAVMAIGAVVALFM